MEFETYSRTLYYCFHSCNFYQCLYKFNRLLFFLLAILKPLVIWYPYSSTNKIAHINNAMVSGSSEKDICCSNVAPSKGSDRSIFGFGVAIKPSKSEVKIDQFWSNINSKSDTKPPDVNVKNLTLLTFFWAIWSR